MTEENRDPTDFDYARRAAYYLASQGLETNEVAQALVSELGLARTTAHQIAAEADYPAEAANAA